MLCTREETYVESYCVQVIAKLQVVRTFDREATCRYDVDLDGGQIFSVWKRIQLAAWTTLWPSWRQCNYRWSICNYNLAGNFRTVTNRWTEIRLSTKLVCPLSNLCHSNFSTWLNNFTFLAISSNRVTRESIGLHYQHSIEKRINC